MRSSWGEELPPLLKRYRRIAVVAVATVLLTFVVVRLSNELQRLIFFDLDSFDAIDLRYLHEDTRDWRDGLYVYDHPVHADYPPPAFPVIWSTVGWLEIGTATWVWAGLSLLCLALLAWLLVRISGVASGDTRLLVWLFPFASYSTAWAVGNGQLTHMVLTLVVLGLWLEQRWRPAVARDLFIALVFALALIKPSVTAPLFWLLVFTPGWRSARAALLVLGIYGALTLIAAAWQPVSALEMMAGWTVGAMVGVHQASEVVTPNVVSLLHLLGLDPKTILPTMLLLAAVGIWSWWSRSASLSLRLGVVAIAAWFWTHHRPYDDMLLILPLVSLFAIARERGLSSRVGLATGVLLAIGAALLIRPQGWDPPLVLQDATVIFSGIFWLGVAGLLVALAGGKVLLPKDEIPPLR